MSRSNMHLFDLPDEILLLILKKLNNIDVLYSLLDVNNGKLDILAQENIFTNNLKFDSANDTSLISRFCIDILPRIHCYVKSFTLHSSFMECILLANKYPNLTELKIIHFQQDFISKYFTNESIRAIFEVQITNLILVNDDPYEMADSFKNYTTNIYAHILSFFKNLKKLNVVESTDEPYPPLSLCDLSLNTFSSSILTHLYINVYTMNDCLYLLDGRLQQLTTLSVHVHIIDDSSTIVHSKDILPNLKCFSLQTFDRFEQYNKILSLLRRMLFVESLTLYIRLKNQNRVIDGTSIQHDILDNMPKLQLFTFYIGADLDTIDLSNEDIQKTLTTIGQSATSTLNHDISNKIMYSIFSLPFAFVTIRELGNSFPDILFNSVTSLLVRDAHAFKHEFFVRIARSFPLLRWLCIANFQSQSSYDMNTFTIGNNQSYSIIEYPHLTSLDVTYAHIDYAEQFLNERKALVPCLTKLSVMNVELKRKDQRRIDLLNDPNYGIVLCFLDKFRSILDLPQYPLQLFEDHLINCQEQNPSRLIDFHFILLKRLSLAKNAQRDKFDSIITKFVSRFDSNDSEQLATIGYLHIDINLKIRTIKYLLESQFDLNQTFKNTISEKLSCHIKSLPLGRDRFGASYWFFMDSNCFVRLFREDVNNDRTWTNIAKNREELEKFIQLLITDSIVRKRFPDWIIGYEPYLSLLPTSEFEQCYLSIRDDVRDEELETTPDNIENSDLSKDKDESSSSPEISTKKKRGRPKRSTESIIEVNCTEVQKETETTIDDDDEESDVLKKRNSRSRKRKVTTEEQEVSLDDMSLATRRSSRLRPTSVVTPDSTSQLSDTTQKHLIKTKTKISPTLRSRRRRKKPSRRNMDDYFCLSTSSSDEHIDDLTDDEYNSDDNQYLVDVEDHFFELDEDNTSMNDQELRTAKTAHTSTIITTCYICSKSDRPEVLLLCDDCNDAYHLECLYPVLLSVPEGDWYCPLCEQKQLSICLINRLKELLIHFNTADTKKQIRSTKKLFQRKIKVKEYSSDESITASESDNNDDSMLSTSQINENSNLSSSYFDDEKQSISQRGRHRRTRFDIKKMLVDEYIDDDVDDNSTDKTNFHLQLPKKITRLLHRHDRSLIKNDSQTRTLPTRV
ncbi:unnamed protein product [Adineta steineri]|uniref:PHD-type domain-containing protein n=1 Tax=Adineta steineri TaxID=433720 RepID=A0A816EC73_9BILA|nr:unnamed protein product [Adineta steineri]CAF1644837.1 unnamed protein product [Adineta steineri]